jgi:hypothetical protein
MPEQKPVFREDLKKQGLLFGNSLAFDYKMLISLSGEKRIIILLILIILLCSLPPLLSINLCLVPRISFTENGISVTL